jgi:hypothetical protein
MSDCLHEACLSFFRSFAVNSITTLNNKNCWLSLGVQDKLFDTDLMKNPYAITEQSEET